MLGIYVHLPFCRKRCTYCAFAISTDLNRQDAYLESLSREIEGSVFRGAEADTLYFGGGTPSVTELSQLIRLNSTIRRHFDLDSQAEVTLEANPEDVTPERLTDWRDRVGVTRLSLGVQSFHDDELYPLGRGHAAATARDAVAMATASGLRVSLDLILGLPNQGLEQFQESLETALAAGVGHLSLYMLDLEEGSALERQVRREAVRLPEDGSVAAGYEAAIQRIARAGLRQYEVSNFARPGQESRHNLKYWNREPYAGLGLGAHSFDGRSRWANTRDLEDYTARLMRGESPVIFREELGSPEKTREEIFLGLRQNRGMRYSDLVQLRGEEATEWVSRGLSEGWLRSSEDRIAFTTSGFLLSNDYLSQLF